MCGEPILCFVLVVVAGGFAMLVYMALRFMFDVLIGLWRHFRR